MVYGIIVEKLHIKSDSELANEDEKQGVHKIHGSLEGVEDMSLSTINLDATELRHSMNLSFSAVVIVPREKEQDALHAAKEVGASGVTILNASGMGLSEIDNFYRHSSVESDKMLLFIVSSQIVDNIIKSIIKKLHITTTGDGIAFSVPITHMKGY